MLKQRLSLSWGPSFAEQETESGWVRVYTAQVPAPQLFKSVCTPENDVQKARISMSVTRRILNTRLGNSVAQIVTQGFENWVLMRQEAEPGRFDLAPSRREPLANPENLFGVSERISADGKVLEPLQIEELRKIATALKSKNIERVCLNFLNAHRNPAHQETASRFLREEGFQVFSRTRDAQRSQDELSAWRRNLLDASLASFFVKALEDFKEAAPNVELEFLDSERGFVRESEVSTSGLLFGREKNLQREKPFLYFGPEEWGWVLPGTQNIWKSPWGPLELQTPQHGFFRTQPGLELLLNAQGQIHWGTDAGLDPGPVLWGRSSKLTLLDFLGWHFETKPALRRNEKTEAKSQDLFASFKKNSRDWRGHSFEQASQEVFDVMLDSLVTDLSSRLGAEEFSVGGVLAHEVLPHLQRARPRWKFELSDHDFRETAGFWRD